MPKSAMLNKQKTTIKCAFLFEAYTIIIADT